jgi:glycine/D-amino acid oxidase-like deaminating enzyme
MTSGCRGRRSTATSTVDVVIVGAGLTGLWTAWYLLESDPTLRVAIVERDTVGFGASGRNGGWCSALLPMSHDRLARRHGVAAAVRMQEAMHDNVAVGSFVDHHAGDRRGIFHRGGTLDLARNLPQRRRLSAEVEHLHRLGFDEDDYRWLDADEARERCRATDVLGALWTPHCATVHPLRLTHLVARAALGRGARIHERTTATTDRAGTRVTDRGTIRCRGGGPGDRGVHQPTAGRATDGPADLLADDRDRAARRRAHGTRSGSPTDRPSPTDGTW